MVGTEQKKWLERIEDDQSLRQLGLVEGTIRNEAGRHYFISQLVGPIAELLEYGAESGRLRLKNRPVQTQAETTSQAATVITIPALESWRIHSLTARNGTTAFAVTLAYNPTDATQDTLTWYWGIAGDEFTPGQDVHAIGPGSMSTASATNYSSLQPGMVFGPGTLTVTIIGFQVADDIDIQIVYEVL